MPPRGCSCLPPGLFHIVAIAVYKKILKCENRAGVVCTVTDRHCSSELMCRQTTLHTVLQPWGRPGACLWTGLGEGGRKIPPPEPLVWGEGAYRCTPGLFMAAECVFRCNSPAQQQRLQDLLNLLEHTFPYFYLSFISFPII